MRINSAWLVPALLMIASGTAGAAVDPALLDLVMPDAKVLFGMQLQQALASPFGQFALARIPDHGTALLQVAAATGFDLRRDLQEILLARSTGTGKWSDSVILARGTFQPAKFAGLARAAGAKITDYHGFTLVRPADRDARAFTFLDSSTVVIGSQTDVEGTIDRRGSRNALNSSLAAKAQAASGTGDAWFATVTPLADLLPTGTNAVPAGFIRSVIESSAGLRFTAGGLTLSAEALTHSPEEAAGLAGVFQFVAGLVKSPQAAFLQSAQFSTSGSTTRITLSVAEQDLERAFPSPAQRRAAR